MKVNIQKIVDTTVSVASSATALVCLVSISLFALALSKASLRVLKTNKNVSEEPSKEVKKQSSKKSSKKADSTDK